MILPASRLGKDEQFLVLRWFFLDLRRIALQLASQPGQLLLRVGVLIAADGPAIQGGAADLFNAGSKGVLHRLKPSLPVVGVSPGRG